MSSTSALCAAQEQEPDLLAELRDLTLNLRGALERFRLDARLVDLAEKEMPDARQRLAHVLTLTDSAAHRTLDLVEQSGPPAERVAREAAALHEQWTRFRGGGIGVAEYVELLERMDRFLVSARTDSELVRANLAEVLLAQGYQDLTGQIIRGVMNLVAEVESALVELTRLAHAADETAERPARPQSNGCGPAVPGVDSPAEVVSGQQDVDALLSGLFK